MFIVIIIYKLQQTIVLFIKYLAINNTAYSLYLVYVCNLSVYVVLQTRGGTICVLFFSCFTQTLTG